MAKQLNSYQVNLQFNANTTQAKTQLQDIHLIFPGAGIHIDSPGDTFYFPALFR